MIKFKAKYIIKNQQVIYSNLNFAIYTDLEHRQKQNLLMIKIKTSNHATSTNSQKRTRNQELLFLESAGLMARCPLIQSKIEQAYIIYSTT